jgi:hypothetical protein
MSKYSKMMAMKMAVSQNSKSCCMRLTFGAGALEKVLKC